MIMDIKSQGRALRDIDALEEMAITELQNAFSSLRAASKTELGPDRVSFWLACYREYLDSAMSKASMAFITTMGYIESLNGEENAEGGAREPSRAELPPVVEVR